MSTVTCRVLHGLSCTSSGGIYLASIVQYGIVISILTRKLELNLPIWSDLKQSRSSLVGSTNSLPQEAQLYSKKSCPEMIRSGWQTSPLLKNNVRENFPNYFKETFFLKSPELRSKRSTDRTDQLWTGRTYVWTLWSLSPLVMLTQFPTQFSTENNYRTGRFNSAIYMDATQLDHFLHTGVKSKRTKTPLKSL